MRERASDARIVSAGVVLRLAVVIGFDFKVEFGGKLKFPCGLPSIAQKETSYDTGRRILCNLRAASRKHGFPHNVDMQSFLPKIVLRLSLVLLASLMALGATTSTGVGQITPEQARKVALLVARHEAINVDDTDTVVDSMDGNGPFVPGYFSFIFIAVDPHRPGKDHTLGVYGVSARTGDIWELNLCKHYDFPELERVQRSIRRKTGAHPGDEAASAKTIGCDKPQESMRN
jgi:hypothetical protein